MTSQAKGARALARQAHELGAPPRLAGHTREDAAISLYARIVGLPASHIEAYLPDFREAFVQEMEAVAEANYRPADFRIGCEVLRHVGSALEEPELQKRLACLLATASNAGKRHHAHPAFPGILTALAPEELRLLSGMRATFDPVEPSGTELERLRAYIGACDVRDVRVALDNLLRLALVERAASSGQSAQERLRLSALGERFLSACFCRD